MSRDEGVVIEFVLEGTTEGAADSTPQPPNRGILPILVHKLCGKPKNMRVVGRAFSHLAGRGLAQKIKFARQRAINECSAGVVFELDSEGNAKKQKKTLSDLDRGRRMHAVEFPTAIGVAQPCIESWLLCDGHAIRRAMNLAKSPDLPDKPESLPAPCKNRKCNPKTVLAEAGDVANHKQELSTAEKDKIAEALDDLQLLRERCPMSFAPFADEVEREINPLFAG